MKKKKIVLIILFLFLFLGYKKWHYESANAFYLSHKRGDSFYKQQKALVKSVNPEVMEGLGIEVTYQEKSRLLYGMTKIEAGISYTFYPETEGDSAIADVIRISDKEALCGFWFEKNLVKTRVNTTELNEEQTSFYKKNAVRIYKQIFEDSYDNWEIQ